MKAATSILTLLWGLLIVQPNFGSYIKNIASSSCNTIAKSSCAVIACKKKASEKNEDKRDCKDDGCNPTLSCPMGNFYFNNSFVTIISLSLPKQKFSLVNDDRLQEELTECWHPPEII